MRISSPSHVLSLCNDRRYTCFVIALAFLLIGSTARAQVPTQAQMQSMFPATLSAKFGPPEAYDFDDDEGFQPIFDGESLEGWLGEPTVWSVQDHKIIGKRGRTPLRNNDYLVYKKLKARDFDLKLEINVITGGSGIQYRSQTGLPWTHKIRGAVEPNLDWMLTGPQADIWAPVPALPTVYSGGLYLENESKGVVAWRGQITQSSANQREQLIGRIGDPIALGAYIVPGSEEQTTGGIPLPGGWNRYHIIARGGVMMHIINGQLMAVYIDDNPESRDNQAGFFGLELEMQPTHIEARNIRVKIYD